MELKRFGKVSTKDVNQADNEKTYVLTAIVYSNIVYRVSGKTVYFLTGNKDSQKYKTKIEQIKKLLKICTELNIDVEKYIQVQFEILLPWIKKIKKLQYLPFNMLVSKNAKERFEKWEKDNNEKYKSSVERKESFKANSIRYRDSIFLSAEIVYKKLVPVDLKFLSQNPLKDIEMLARLGEITKLYIYSHPKILADNLTYLGKIKKQMEQILSDFEKELVQELRKKINEIYGAEYV